MDILPPELFLYLVPFFPLASLIATRDVNTRWRSFVQTASLYPARKVLLDLYLAAIVHPNFPSLVAALKPYVQEFDREAYIADLMSRGCVLPDVFELWVLEWPSSAIHFWAWPGLAADVPVDHDYYCGWNSLGGVTPTISTIPVPKKEVAAVGNSTCWGLELWQVHFKDEVGVAQLWLVVDANERVNNSQAGRLLWTCKYYVHVNIGEPDGTQHVSPEPRRIFYDTPFGAFKDFKLTDFLEVPDSDRYRLEWKMEGDYLVGVRWFDDDD